MTYGWRIAPIGATVPALETWAKPYETLAKEHIDLTIPKNLLELVDEL
jgi:hypothetical protein